MNAINIVIKTTEEKPEEDEEEEEEEFVKYGTVDEFYDLEKEIGKWVSYSGLISLLF